MRPSGLLLATALLLASPAALADFQITLTFGAGLSDVQKATVQSAADYWNTQITGYKTGVTLTGFNIQVDTVNLAGDYLANAGPTATTSQTGTLFTTAGHTNINLAYYGAGTTYNGANALGDVMKHEFGHILGIGTLWVANGLYVDDSGRYTGANALAGWRDEFNQAGATFVPVELGGGGGTANGHWNEVDGGAGPTGFVSKYTGKDFEFEVMTGWANTPTFTSSVTFGTLTDLGYRIGLATDANDDYLLDQGVIFAPLVNNADTAYQRKMRKVTTGTVTLMGDNTFSGGSSLEAGTLIAGSFNALGTGTVSITGATLDVASVNLVTGALVLVRGSIVGSTGSLRATSFDLRNGTVSATLSGAGAVTKNTDGSATGGTVTLSGANTYTGGTIVASGKLVAASAGALSTGAVTVSGGTLEISKAAVDIGPGVVTLTGGAITGTTGSLAATVFDLRNGTVSATLAGAGVVTKSTSGTVILSGQNTYEGGTTVSAGTLVAASSGALSTGPVTVSGGVLSVGTVAVTGVGAVILDTGSITGTTGSLAAASIEARSGVLSAALAGAGALTKVTSGEVTLSGNGSTFTGGVTVTAGRLIASGANALGAGAITIAPAGTLLIAHADAAEKATLNVDGVGTLSFGTLTAAKVGSLRGAADLALVNASSGALALSVGGTNEEFNSYKGTLSGAGSLTKIGTGTLRLEKDNSYTGGTVVSAGVLETGRTGSLGSGDVLVAGGTLNIGSRRIAGVGKVTVDSGEIFGSGTIAATGFEVRSGEIASKLIGSGALTKTGSGTAVLSAVNTYTGGTTVTGGTLVVATPSALAAGSVAVSSGVLEFAGSGGTVDVTRAITGTGSVAFTGAGTTRLRGSALPTGDLFVGSGHTLSLGAFSGDSASVSSSRLIVDVGGALRGSGTIAGSLINRGNLSPGFSPGTINLAGDFVNTGTLNMEIASASVYDRVHFAGQAFLGGTLNITFIGATPADGTPIDLLTDTNTADGKASFVGAFSSVLIPAGSGVAFINGTTLRFIVGGTLFDLPGANISERLRPLTQAVAAANLAVTNALNPVSMPVSSLAGALQAASPLALSSAVALPVAEALRDSDELRRHLDGRRFERTGSSDFDWSPYLSANGMDVTNKAGVDNAVFNYRTFGGLVGIDGSVGGELTLGARVSYDSGRASFHDGGGKLEQDHVRVTIYGSRLISGKFYVDAGAFGGTSLYDTKRNTVLGAETGDASGWDAGLLVNTGFVAPITSAISVTPHAGFTYTHANVGGYEEEGSALALSVKEMSHNSLAGRVGSGVNAITAVAGMPLRVGFDVSIVHEFLDNETDIGASFRSSPGSSFNTSAVVMPKDRLEAGPELDLQVAPGRSITASYRYEYAFGEATGHRVDVGFRSRF